MDVPSRRAADPARRAACDVLCALTPHGAHASQLLPALLSQRGLSGRDAALAAELTYGTLRGRGSYDAILAICADRDLAAIDRPVLEVLRLGAHQLLGTRVRPHAAVATSVDLARDVAGQRPAGFVNAVLRRVAQRDLAAWLTIAAPGQADDLTGHLAVRCSHPRWIVTALRQALGEEPDGGLAETRAALAAGGTRQEVTLCALPGQCGQAELIAAGAEPARWSPLAARLRDGDPALISAVAQGRACVQDEASQLAALALSRVELAGSDRSWLDLCAGPGAKARLLAGLAAGRGARLLAADLRFDRARLIAPAASVTSATARRTAAAGRRTAAVPAAPGRVDAAGDAGAVNGAGAGGQTGSLGIVVADGLAGAWRPGAFDRVLADVPSSGLGVLHRRPEARWHCSPAEVSELAGLQQRLLAAALDAVRPGGVVAYVACSPHLAETRQVVSRMLADRGDVQLLDAPAVLAEVPGLACPEPSGRLAQFWPHRHGTDAVFLALLRRGGP